MVYENVRMITNLPTKRISAILQWKTFIRVLPTRWRRKPASIEITSPSPCAFKCPVLLLTNVTTAGWRQIRRISISCTPDRNSTLLMHFGLKMNLVVTTLLIYSPPTFSRKHPASTCQCSERHCCQNCRIFIGRNIEIELSRGIHSTDCQQAQWRDRPMGLAGCFTTYDMMASFNNFEVVAYCAFLEL